jgi:trehalose 6-phosphate phosphatase
MTASEIDRAIAELSRAPSRTALFTDFDGTLAPIVADPEDAMPAAGAMEVLRELVAHLAFVAVVSGRQAAWLAGRLADGAGPERLQLFGLHGLEQWVAGQSQPVDAARPWLEVVAAARARAEAAAATIPGLAVEDKQFGLTLHWRRASDPAAVEAAGAALAHELATESGMLERPGKASVELVPPLGIDKGTVVREHGRGLGAAAFLGDDAGDLRAFDGLDVLAASGVTVCRIAVSSLEAPAELIERADLVLEGPDECVEMLRRLGAAVRSDP